jgi:hypothetical protein
MQRARVCTGKGYSSNEYNTNHNFDKNLNNLKKIRDDMYALLVELNDIQNNINCQDYNSIVNATVIINQIEARLTGLIANFNSELVIITNKLKGFLVRINAVIAIYKIDYRSIMIECKVNKQVAIRMQNYRLIALKSFRIFEKEVYRTLAQIGSIDLQQHNCSTT